MDYRTVLTALVPIGVAIVGGIMAILGIKGNIISTARIKWIQDFRFSLCDYIELVERFQSIILLGRPESDIYEAIRLSDSIRKNKNQIMLYLNWDEDKHESLLRKLDQLETQVTAMVKATNEDPVHDDIEVTKNEIIIKTQSILKEAWEDAKSFNVKDLLRFKWGYKP